MDSLEALNERFWLWLEEDYHRRVHASLDGCTPHEMFQQQLETVRFLEDISVLDTIFLKREQRKVKPDGTISLNKKLYEVPPRFVGKTVDIRLNETDVFIYEEGIEVAKILPVIFEDNAHVKRERSLSFSKMRNEKAGEADV